MSRFSHEDYTNALLNLLPSGPAWSRETDSVRYRLVSALAEAYRGSDSAARELLAGAFPATVDALTEEWYESLGLYSDCGVRPPQDQSEAVCFIMGKLLATGGQSREYFVALAKAMGFRVTVEEFRTPLCGFSSCGSAVLNAGRFWSWLVTVEETGEERTTLTYLKCLFRKFAPAHTEVLFTDEY